MTITNEDLKLIRKFDELKQKGYYCDSMQLTTVYNRVLNKNVNNTVCGSCLRQRIAELVAAADKFEREQKIQNEAISSPSDSVEEVKVDSNPQEENKANTEPPVKANRKRK